MKRRTPVTLVGIKSRLVDADGRSVWVGLVLHESDKMIHLLTERGVKKLPKGKFTIIVESGDAKLETAGGLLRGKPVSRLKRRRRVWSRP